MSSTELGDNPDHPSKPVRPETGGEEGQRPKLAYRGIASL